MNHDSDEVAWLSIDGRGRHNLLDAAAIAELNETLDRLIVAPPRVVLVVGGTSFSAGADLAELGSMTPETFGAYLAAELDLFDKVERLPCPTVAVVSGRCQGSGAELALACDLRVAGTSATFSLPEVAAGFPAPVHRLARLLPAGLATELVYTGRRLSAREAADVHLFNQVVADDELLDAARLWGDRLAATAPAAMTTTKEWLARAYAGEPVSREEVERLSASIFSAWQDQ